MVKVTLILSKSQVFFDCPRCGARDIVYINQNRMCHLCDNEYDFSVPYLRKNLNYRTQYHFKHPDAGRIKCSV